MNIAASEKPAEATAGIELSPKMRQLLKDPIVPTLLHMAWPNILIMLAQASTGLIETFWVARLGTDALAGMALVFPIVDDGADDGQRRDGWRNLLGDRARTRRWASRRG